MNAIDKKRAKLYAMGEELRDNHRRRACGRRGCDCLKKYDRIRQQYVRLIEGIEEQPKRGAGRRRGRE